MSLDDKGPHPGQPRHPGPELDRLPEGLPCDLPGPKHEGHPGDSDLGQPERADDRVHDRAWELHVGEPEEDGEEQEEDDEERPNAPLPLERRFTMDRLLH